LRFYPRTVGIHPARITVYHDGNAEGFTVFEVRAETRRMTDVVVSGATANLTPTPVTDFGVVGYNSGVRTKTVTLTTTGEGGRVTFNRFEVHGTADIRVSSVQRAGGYHHDYCRYLTREKVDFAVESESLYQEGDIGFVTDIVPSTRCPFREPTINGVALQLQ